MFYQESKISQLLKCQNCNQKYDEPRLLPCGKTLCNSCIKSLTSQSTAFKCLCSKIHQASEFPINESIKLLMLEQPNEVYRNEQVELLKSNMNTIEFELDDLKYHMDNGANQIIEHCFQLRNQISLKTNNDAFKIISGMKNFTEILSDKINAYETECLLNFTSDSNEYRRNFNENYAKINKFLIEQKQYLSKFKIDNDEIETAIKTSEEFKSKLLKEKSNNSSNLLFKPNQKSVELDILLAMFNKIKANQFF